MVSLASNPDADGSGAFSGFPLLSQQAQQLFHGGADVMSEASVSSVTRLPLDTFIASASEIDVFEDIQKHIQSVSNLRIFYKKLSGIQHSWSENGTLTTFFEDQLQQIIQKYVLREPKDVLRVLRRHPLEVQLLLDASNKIRSYFPDSKVFLEISTDFNGISGYTEMSDGYEEVIISVLTSLSSDEAIKILTNLYTDWWLKASKNVQGKVSLGLEFL